MRQGRRGAQALVETALVIPVLLTLAFGVVGVGRLTQTQMAVDAVAREAARTGAMQDNAADAQRVGQDRGFAVGVGYHLSHPPLKVQVDPSQFARCGSVSAHAEYPLDFKDLPFFGWANLTLQANQTEPVDGYRNNLTGKC